jgi:hypothetical protein
MNRGSGGFNDSLRSQMSPALQRAMAEQESEERREAARAEREKKQRVEAFAENSFRAAVEQAIADGVDPTAARIKGVGVGRTVGQALAYYSAMADAEDARLMARVRQAFREWEAQQSASTSADMTAPSEQEMASRAESEARHREARINSAVRKYERAKTVEEARKDAWHAALTVAAAAERQR